MNITGRDVTVTWDAWDPEGGDPGDVPVIGYAVDYRPADGSSGRYGSTAEWRRGAAVEAAVLSATVGGLDPETDYEVSVTVRREGQGGEGGPSPILSVTTLCTGQSFTECRL